MTDVAVEYVDQLEIAHIQHGLLNVLVFGPGRGEATMLVAPDGDVGVVDGCAWPSDDAQGYGDPVHVLVAAWMARERHPPYRQELAFACVTHMHDDHYLGLESLLRRFPPRCLWRTIAATDRELAVAAQLAGLSSSTRQSTGLRRLEKTMRGLEAFEKRAHGSIEHRLLEANGESHQPCPGCVQLEVLPAGPSQRELLALKRRIDARLKTGKALDADVNATSGAVYVRWADARVLLAGDLIATEPSVVVDDGWKPFATRLAKEASPRVQVVNVAHHGSAKAHDSALWKAMNPELAIVTPFQHATNKMPPRPSDISRYLASGARVLITATPKWGPASASHPKRKRQSPSKGGAAMRPPAAPGASSVDDSDIRNAVLVALDDQGAIRKIVAAGQASEYAL